MTRSLRTGLATLACVIAAAPIMARQDAGLKDLMPKIMVIGVAINQRQRDGADAAAVDIINKQFNQITPENLLKFQSVHPAADRYTFDAQDRFVQFGVERKMQIGGHTLVWHNQTGTWVFQAVDGKPADRETLLARMRDHIHTVVGRYKGKIHGWDVVNEAIDEDGSLRQTTWRDGIGDDYVAKAFEFASEADPNAELYTGLKLMYTELDIDLLPSVGRGADRVSRVTFWGLSDGDSWLNRGRMTHPLLWGRQCHPKPAFHAVVDVLKRER